MVSIKTRDWGSRPRIKNENIFSPLISKVSVEINPPTQPQCEGVACPVLPPQPVRGVGVLIPVWVYNRQYEEVVIVEHGVMARVGHQISYDVSDSCRADPFSCMDTSFNEYCPLGTQLSSPWVP